MTPQSRPVGLRDEAVLPVGSCVSGAKGILRTSQGGTIRAGRADVRGIRDRLEGPRFVSGLRSLLNRDRDRRRV